MQRAYFPHCKQINIGMEKFNTSVNDSSSLAKIQIYILVKTNEEYFLLGSSNILRMLTEIISQKRCAELLQIMAKSIYSIHRCLLLLQFLLLSSFNVLVSCIQRVHLIIVFSNITVLLCIAVPKPGGVSRGPVFTSEVPN